MFAKLTTKIALRKAGIPSNTFDIPNYPAATNSKDPNAASPFQSIQDTFANLQVPKALKSWQTPIPPPVEVAQPPVVGDRAPSNVKLSLPIGDGRPSVVVFLRHCGCPCLSPPLLLVPEHFEVIELIFLFSRRKDLPRSPPTS
jgi:hypothetical protein